MKHCISKLIKWIGYLWRTVKEYVRKKTRNHVRFEDTDVDGVDEIIIDLNSTNSDDVVSQTSFSVISDYEINKIEEEINHDTKPNSR